MPLPPKWTEVYPHGTKEGDDELAFFCVLARKKWDWVSTMQIVKETNLPRERVEQIIAKYLNWKPPLIFQSGTKDDHWAYWERVPDLTKPPASLGDVDRGNRIRRQLEDPLNGDVYSV